MFSFEASATLPYDPGAAFGALASLECAVRWQVGVVGVRRARPASAPRDGAPRRGALLLGYYALGVRHTLRARVTAYAPPARFAYRAENAAFALDVGLGFAPALGGTELRYGLCLTTPAPASAGVDADADIDAAEQVAAFRRLLVRRAPRDLARLEYYLGRRLWGTGAVPLSVPGARAQNPARDRPGPLPA